ncbi:MAG: AI-2E family transporter [Planctomycetota bacterium]
MRDEDQPSDQPIQPSDAAAAMPGIGRELQWQSVCLLVLTVLAVGGALYFLRPVLVPFILAIFFAVGLSPLLDLIERRLKASRVGAVSIAFLLGLALVSLLGTAIGVSITALTADNAYRESAKNAVESIADFAVTIGLMPEAAGGITEAPPGEADAPQDNPDAPRDNPDATESEPGSAADGTASAEQSTDPAGGPLETNADRLATFLGDSADGLKGWLVGEMASLLSTLSVVLLFMFFLLLGASGDVRPTEGPARVVEEKLREYVVLKTVISVFTGFAVWIVLLFFNVPLALVFGLLTFLFNFIPNFGPLVTCVLPLPVIWLNPGLSLVSKVIASVLVIGVQLISGNVVEPKVMGDSFDLHPIVVLLALLLWGAIWGFVGMLLAVPISAAIKILLQKMERTRPIAQVMGGDLAAIKFGDETRFGQEALF